MLSFSFCTDHRHIFCSSCSRRISEKSRKEICIAAPIEIRVLKNLFPDSRSVKLKERDTVNSTAHLSTWRHLTNQSMIPESGIMERRHQKHVSRLRRPFPLPRRPLGSLRSPIFFLFGPVFCLFPPLRSLVPGYYYKQGRSVLHEFFCFFTFEGRYSFSQKLQFPRHFCPRNL